MESVPPGVDGAKVRASNFIPVCLCVCEGWNSQVLGLSANRESSLGDPDGLASDSTLGSSQRSVEQALAIGDAVCHCVLEVWVCVHSDEVASGDDLVEIRIGGLGPGER